MYESRWELREEVTWERYESSGGIWSVKNKKVSNIRSWREVLNNYKKVQMICGTRWPKRLEKYLKTRWKNKEVLDPWVKNRSGGIKVFRVKLELKKNCFKEWSRCKNDETWEKYKKIMNKTKKAMSEARAQTFEGLYQSLGTNGIEIFDSIYLLREEKER